MTSTPLPLEGLLVADFSRVLAGPLATAVLADLGAEVIKIERPGVGDDTRHWGPPWTEISSSYYESANRSKRSIELDLADETDHALARELVRRADVVVENFKTGTLDKRGLGYADVHELNPRAVYCSVTGFGSAGGADLPGYDFLVQAVGGLMSITGSPDSEGGEPTKVGVALVDILTSKDAVIGILAALRHRESTGLGQHVEVNLLSSLLGSLANQAAGYLATGTAPGRMGNAHPSVAPYQLLHCSDQQLAVAAANDGQFRRLVTAVGAPELADREEYASNGARVSNRASLVDHLEKLLATDTADHWAAKLAEVGVPAGKVGTVGEAIELATSLGLAPVVDVGPGATAQIRHAATYSATPVTHYTAAPRLGEHNQEVRAWLETPR